MNRAAGHHLREWRLLTLLLLVFPCGSCSSTHRCTPPPPTRILTDEASTQASPVPDAIFHPSSDPGPGVPFDELTPPPGGVPVR